MGDNNTGDISKAEAALNDTSQDMPDDSSLVNTTAVLDVSSAAAGGDGGGSVQNAVESLYHLTDDDMAQLEREFSNKISLQQEVIMKNVECMNTIEQQLLSMNEKVEGSDDSVSSRVEKFGILNRSLEKLKSDIDNMMMQREDAQTNLSELANKMAADQKLIEAKQKKLEKGVLAQEIEAYEKVLGITVDYDKVKCDDGHEANMIRISFPDLCNKYDKPAVYVQMQHKKDKESGKFRYEVYKHDPEVGDMSQLLDSLNAAGSSGWKEFVSKLRESFTKQLESMSIPTAAGAE